MLSISQQTNPVAYARVAKAEVADREAALVTFVDDQEAPLSWVQIARSLSGHAEGHTESSTEGHAEAKTEQDHHFRTCWNQTWADLPFDFEWKPVPIHPYTARTHPFFAIAFPATFRPADPTDFQSHLQGLPTDQLTTTFSNFSGDAQLLVPKPINQDTDDYGHIAAFCRTATAAVQQALWQRVGELCMQTIAEDKTVWCNTHGHGVPWLHIRFDKRLKYASFPPRGSISANSQAIWYQQIYRAVIVEG